VHSRTDDCSFQTITVFGNLLCTAAVVALLSYRWWWRRTGEDPKRIRTESSRQNLKIRYRGKFFLHHNSIWILTIVVCLTLLTQFAESLTVFFSASNHNNRNSLSNTLPPAENAQSNSSGSGVSESGPSWIYNNLRLWSPLSSILALSCISIFYQHIESTQESKYLVLNVLYFGGSSVLAITKLDFHLRQGLTFLHVKVFSEIFGGIGTITLLVLLIHALIIAQVSLICCSS